MSHKLNIDALKAPETTLIMLHLSNKKHALDHLEWWLPILRQSNVGFSILTRDTKSFKKVKNKYPNLPILFAKSTLYVETVIKTQPNLMAVLHTSNMANNIHLLRFNHLQHIFIGSKNSEWLGSIDKTYRAYDEIWVSGDYQYNKIINSIEDTRHLKIHRVGKPQLKEIFLDKTNIQNSIYLYTLKPSNSTSFYKMPISAQQNIKSLFGPPKIYQLSYFLTSTLFRFRKTITDNAIIVDLPKLNIWLFTLQKPVFVYMPKSKVFIHKSIPKEVVTTFSSYQELTEYLKKDTRQKEREQFIEKVFGKSFTLNDAFIEHLKRITNNTADRETI